MSKTGKENTTFFDFGNTSTELKRMFYDETTEKLYVRFHSGELDYWYKERRGSTVLRNLFLQLKKNVAERRKIGDNEKPRVGSLFRTIVISSRDYPKLGVHWDKNDFSKQLGKR